MDPALVLSNGPLASIEELVLHIRPKYKSQNRISRMSKGILHQLVQRVGRWKEMTE